VPASNVRFITAATLALVLVGSLASPAAAGTTDPEDTRGPLDLRWLDLDAIPGDRVRLTFGFWSGFRAAELAGNSQEGLLVRFRLPELEYVAIGYTLFQDGHLRFRQGDFGSSACCYRSKFIRLDRRSFTTVFVPWWVRTGEQENDRVRYWGRTKVCKQPCIADHTRRDLID
jgi:hypothetical protein